MDKAQIKKLLIELIENDELKLVVDGYSDSDSHTVSVALEIDGKRYIQEEIQLHR